MRILPDLLDRGQGWPLAPDSVIGTILHTGTPDYVWFDNGVPTNDFVIDMTRVLLMVTFVGIALAVRIAWKNKKMGSSI